MFGGKMMATPRIGLFCAILSKFKAIKPKQFSNCQRAYSAAADNVKKRSRSFTIKYIFGNVIVMVGFSGAAALYFRNQSPNENNNTDQGIKNAIGGTPAMIKSDLKPLLAAHAAEDASRPWHLQNPPTKQVRHNAAENTTRLTLYQYTTCPFCCKVRAYLDYHGINYDIVEVDSIKRTQTKWSSYKKVPMLVYNNARLDDTKAGDDYLQLRDSTVIVSVLDSDRVNESQVAMEKLLSFYPAIESREGKKMVYDIPNKYFVMYENRFIDRELSEIREEREWREWVDDNLVHVLSPNAYRTLTEAVQSFRWFSKVGDWESCMSNWSRLTCIYAGAIVMWGIGGRLKRKYNLDDDVRQSLYSSINDWLAGIGPDRKFMGGAKPNLADLAVYGVMCSIEGCKAFQDLSEHTKFMDWYTPMKASVLNHDGRARIVKREAGNA